MRNHLKVAWCALALLLALGITPAFAETITTWHFAGGVSGYQCGFSGNCSVESFAAAVPLGTMVDLYLTLDLDAPESSTCPGYYGEGSAVMQLLGQSFSSGSFIWVDAYGFGGGCRSAGSPGSGDVEIIFFPGGPDSLSGWRPTSSTRIPGVYWPTAGQTLPQTAPNYLFLQTPMFVSPPDSPFQIMTFTAPMALVPVPEPTTIALFGIGLVGVWRGRRRLAEQRIALQRVSALSSISTTH